MFTKILFLCSSINVGDVAHSNAVYDILPDKVNPIVRYNIEANCDDESLVSNFISIVSKLGSESYVIYAVGEKGSNALNTILNKNSLKLNNAYIALGIHQYFNVIDKLDLDYISIPEAVVKDNKLKFDVIKSIPKYSLTLTVPTANPSIASLKTSYENWNTADKPALDGKYIVVMLPGDAPTDEKMQYFTEGSAEKLFNAIYSLWHDNPEYKIIVDNGPRTGKHNPNNGQVKCTHEFKKGEDSSKAVDDVSKYFVRLLEQKEVPYQFFNFEFEGSENGKSLNSVFNQLLYLAQSSNENFFIIPGESISMIGQIPLYIYSNKAILFKPSSMNADHEAIFEQAFEKSFISYFNDEGKIIYPKENIKREQDDAHQVVTDLIEGYNNSLIGVEDAYNSNF